jgi:hypothetical protein
MMPERGLGSTQQHKPSGHKAIGVFLLFAATMASFAAFTLAFPGTILDRAWALNPEAHRELSTLGPFIAFPFALLSAALLVAGIGWFQRRRWAWILAIVLVAINLSGDFFNLLRGEWLKGAVGVVIAGLLLTYLGGRRIRGYFDA